jgi:hypothetical protein
MHIFLDVHPRHLMSCPVIGLQRAAHLTDDEDDDSQAEEPRVPPVPRVNGTSSSARVHAEADEMKCA